MSMVATILNNDYFLLSTHLRSWTEPSILAKQETSFRSNVLESLQCTNESSFVSNGCSSSKNIVHLVGGKNRTKQKKKQNNREHYSWLVQHAKGSNKTILLWSSYDLLAEYDHFFIFFKQLLGDGKHFSHFSGDARQIRNHTGFHHSGQIFDHRYMVCRLAHFI